MKERLLAPFPHCAPKYGLCVIFSLLFDSPWHQHSSYYMQIAVTLNMFFAYLVHHWKILVKLCLSSWNIQKQCPCRDASKKSGGEHISSHQIPAIPISHWASLEWSDCSQSPKTLCRVQLVPAITGDCMMIREFQAQRWNFNWMPLNFPNRWYENFIPGSEKYSDCIC